jgi:hypothetical protein
MKKRRNKNPRVEARSMILIIQGSRNFLVSRKEAEFMVPKKQQEDSHEC